MVKINDFAKVSIREKKECDEHRVLYIDAIRHTIAKHSLLWLSRRQWEECSRPMSAWTWKPQEHPLLITTYQRHATTKGFPEVGAQEKMALPIANDSNQVPQLSWRLKLRKGSQKSLHHTKRLGRFWRIAFNCYVNLIKGRAQPL